MSASDHRIEDDDQLAHAGNERNFRLFAPGGEALIVGLEHRIMLGRRAEARKEQAVSHPAPPPLDVALASALAAVIVVRGDSNVSAVLALPSIEGVERGMIDL